jgi:hypothetical protein
MDHLALPSHPQGQIETGVELSLSAFTSRLAADPGHRDQGADEQGFVVQNLGQAGSRLAFLRRQVTSVAHRNTSFYLIYLYISDTHDKVKLFLNANLLKIEDLPKSAGYTRSYE